MDCCELPFDEWPVELLLLLVVDEELIRLLVKLVVGLLFVSLVGVSGWPSCGLSLPLFSCCLTGTELPFEFKVLIELLPFVVVVLFILTTASFEL